MEFMGKTQMLVLVMRIRHDKKNGNKWIHLSQKAPFTNYNFPYIAVKEAYLLINAMDSLMSKLAENENNHPSCELLIKGSHAFDYNLNINTNKNGQLEFTMESIKKQTQMKVPRAFPIRSLPLIRDQMAKLLAEHDGTQQIGLCPSLPKWMEEDENANKLQEAIFYRDTLEYKVDDKPRDRKIQIVYKQGTIGTEFIYINQAFDKRMNIGKAADQFFKFANISIQDAQQLLDAMEIMCNNLKKQQPIYQNQSSMIGHQFVQGLWYDYKLEIHSCPNKQLNFMIQTILNTDKNHLHMPTKLYGPVPLSVFRWLKEQMEEILEFDKQLESLNIGEKEDKSISVRFPPIPVKIAYHLLQMDPFKPKMKEAYLLINAMDSLMSKLAENENNHPSCELLIKGSHAFDYNLNINTNKNGQLEFTMESIKKQTQMKVPRAFPIRSLPLIRDQMAKLLAEHDGTQQIGLCPSLPKWMEEDENANKLQEAIFYRDTLEYKVDDKPRDRKIQIVYKQGTIGTEFIYINQAFDKRMNIGKAADQFFKFANISIQDAQQLLDAMEIMCNNLKKQQPIYQNQSSMIGHQFVQGLWYDYKLEIHSCPNKQLNFMIQTILNTDKNHLHMPTKLYGPVPLSVFRWLKEQMEEILEFDKQLESLNIGEKEDKSISVRFPPIPVKIAYHLLNAMCTLSDDFKKKCTEFQISDKILTKKDQTKIKNLAICHRSVRGLRYDYKLEINISPIFKQLEFQLQTIATKADPSHEPKKLYGPIQLHLFNWLKEQMAELLKSYSTSNQQKQNKHRIKQLESDENVDGKQPITYREEANNGMHERLIRIEQKDSRMDIEPAGDKSDYDGNDSRNEVKR